MAQAFIYLEQHYMEIKQVDTMSGIPNPTRLMEGVIDYTGALLDATQGGVRDIQ